MQRRPGDFIGTAMALPSSHAAVRDATTTMQACVIIDKGCNDMRGGVSSGKSCWSLANRVNCIAAKRLGVQVQRLYGIAWIGRYIRLFDLTGVTAP